MAHLSPDQQAVLQLVLRRGRTYAQIAELTGRDEATVRERARTALDALAPAGIAAPDAADQARVSDWLLGQQHGPDADRTEALLRSDDRARDWAGGVRGALTSAGVAGADSLPKIPSGDGRDGKAGAGEERGDRADRTAAATAAHDRGGEASRTGGAVLLGLLAAALILAVLWQTGVLGDKNERSAGGERAATASAGSGGGSTTTGKTQGTRVEKQVNLKPQDGSKKMLGVANIVSQNGERALAVVADGVPRGAYFGLWVTNGERSRFLGFFRAITQSKSGPFKLAATTGAPRDLGKWSQIRITKEPSGAIPKKPGATLLYGDFNW